jgi:hypothetical protein
MVAAVLATAPQLKKTQVSRLYPFAEFNAAASAMDNSGVQDIFTLDVEGLSRICVRLNVATNALAAFQIKAFFSSEDNSVTLFSTAADFLSPRGLLIGASGDLTTLAVGSGWFIMDVTGISKVVLSANSGNAGGSTLALSAGGQ